MPLRRINPVIEHYDLGFLRLWRDDIARIVELAAEVGGTVQIESDNFKIEDVDTELPQVGPRIEYLKVAVTSNDENFPPRELLSLRLSGRQSYIEATDPDAQTDGIIGHIRELVEHRRRLPRWLVTLAGGDSGPIWVILALAIIIPLAAIDLLVGRPYLTLLEWHASGLITCSAGIVLGVLLITISTTSSTILFTGTRTEAPTWWQQHRSEIGIHIVVGVVFFLLGLLVANI